MDSNILFKKPVCQFNISNYLMTLDTISYLGKSANRKPDKIQFLLIRGQKRCDEVCCDTGQRFIRVRKGLKSSI